MAERWRFVLVTEDLPKYRAMTRLCVWSIRRRAGRLADAPISLVFNERVSDETRAWFRDDFRCDVSVRPRIEGIPKTSYKFNALLAPEIEPGEWLVYADCDCVVANDLGPLVDLTLAMAERDGIGFASTPTNMKQAWGLDRIFARYTGRPRSSFERLRHPWFLEGLPVFNSGVFVLRSEHAGSLFREVAPLCAEVMRRGRATSPNPLHWAKTQWNRRVWKGAWKDRLVIPPWYPRNHAGQIALPIALLRLGVEMGVLPHAYNWRMPGLGQGEDDPIRILHYCGHHRFPFDRAEVLSGDYVDGFARSGEPGRVALAEAVRAYASEHGASSAAPEGAPSGAPAEALGDRA